MAEKRLPEQGPPQALLPVPGYVSLDEAFATVKSAFGYAEAAVLFLRNAITSARISVRTMDETGAVREIPKERLWNVRLVLETRVEWSFVAGRHIPVAFNVPTGEVSFRPPPGDRFWGNAPHLVFLRASEIEALLRQTKLQPTSSAMCQRTPAAIPPRAPPVPWLVHRPALSR
jgi:hypothetical protein